MDKIEDDAIPAGQILRTLIDTLGMAKTLHILENEAEYAAIRCGTLAQWQPAACNYLRIARRVRTLRLEAYGND